MKSDDVVVPTTTVSPASAPDSDATATACSMERPPKTAKRLRLGATIAAAPAAACPPHASSDAAQSSATGSAESRIISIRKKNMRYDPISCILFFRS